MVVPLHGRMPLAAAAEVQRYAQARDLELDSPAAFRVARDGVIVQVRARALKSWIASRVVLEVSARAPAPTTLSMATTRRWGRWLRPRADAPAWKVRAVEPGDGTALHGDPDRRLVVLPAVAAAATRLADDGLSSALVLDGAFVVARVKARGDAYPDELIDAVIAAVVALARFDDGLGDTLAALPDASPLHEHDLDPGVVLAPDDVHVGVRAGRETIAQLETTALQPIEAEVRDGVVTVEVDAGGALLGLTRDLLAGAGTATLGRRRWRRG